MAAEGYTSHTDLHIGVTFPLHHASHEVVLGYEVLGLHQVDSQNSLKAHQRQGAVNVAEGERVVSAALQLYGAIFLPLLQTLDRVWCAAGVTVEVSLTRLAP